MMINHRFLKAVFKDLVQSNIAMLIIAITTLILGAILVVIHNIWVYDWRVSITLLSWLALFAGTVRTLFPTFIQRMASQLLTRRMYFNSAGTVAIIVGITMLYFGLR